MTAGSSNDTSGTTTAAVGEVRRCLCYYISDETKRGDYSDEELTFSGRHPPTPRCSACVHHLLRASLQRHKQALRDHAATRSDCERALGSIARNHIPELQAESQRLRDRSAALRLECGSLALRVAQMVSENDAVRDTMARESSPLDRQRLDLQQLEQSLLEGSLTQAIETATSQVRFLRFQWAQKVFAMHRLQIDPEHSKLTPLQKRRQNQTPGQRLQRRAKGIPKISGLPLPNAGPELYGFLPPRELQSALRIVAIVTSTVARCLGIVLPHRVLTTPNHSDSAVGDIAETVTEEDLRERGVQGRKTKAVVTGPRRALGHDPNASDPSHALLGAHHGGGYGGAHHYHQPSVISSSTASLYSMMESSYFYNKAKKALAKATGHRPTPMTTIVTPGTNAGTAAMTRGRSSSISRTSSSISRTSRTSNSSSSNSTSGGRGSGKTIERSFDATIVAQRIHHATAAILSDVNTTTDVGGHGHGHGHNACSSSTFALSTKEMNKGDDFAIALQLLQNNVVTLCIRAGVPVSRLWPAEAMLLNLHELNLFCQKQTSVQY